MHRPCLTAVAAAQGHVFGLEEHAGQRGARYERLAEQMASPEPLMLVGSGGAACQLTVWTEGSAGEPSRCTRQPFLLRWTGVHALACGHQPLA